MQSGESTLRGKALFIKDGLTIVSHDKGVYHGSQLRLFAEVTESYK